MLKIYNTLTRRKDEFKPLREDEVKMYTCGVTVYDDCHLGHGRSLYIFETIRKYLQFRGYSLKFVRNITDVDDKIINRAKELALKGGISLPEAFDEVRLKYIERYEDDLKNLGIKPADIEPKATENIPEMIRFIEGLINKGFAYEKKGSVYFRVTRFKDYGKLSGRCIDDLFSGVRIEPDPLKEDVRDFALWKARKDEEPFWKSPFGDGRPGWHIECSVMANKYLSTTIDIHGGGKDLIFPHHENEIAQSESLNGLPFARYWIHHGLITINSQKMSKSLGNFITLREAVDRYSADVLKIFYLSAHYRSPLDFSAEKIEESKKVAERIITFIKQTLARVKRSALLFSDKEKCIFSSSSLKELFGKFTGFMDDDFNMPAAFSVIFDVIRLVNESGQVEDVFLKEALKFIYIVGEIFSFSFIRIITGEVVERITVDDEFIREKVSQRAQLRKEKKFKEADAIRDELLKMGIVLEDRPGGETVWYVKESKT